MERILIFSGTSEGRELAEYLAERKLHCVVSVATEYGKLVMEKKTNIEIVEGRLQAKQMQELMLQKGIKVVVDATHPFATEVTKQIKQACKLAECDYYRLSRFSGEEMEEVGQKSCSIAGKDGNEKADNQIRVVADTKQAAQYLQQTTGNILLTTGSKELPVFMEHIEDKERVYVRVLPSIESLSICKEQGLEGKHVIAMQGPFSLEMNIEMLKAVNASFLVTKESGLRGGYAEKIQAAKAIGCKCIVIEKPETEVAFSLEEMKAKIMSLLQIAEVQKEMQEVTVSVEKEKQKIEKQKTEHKENQTIESYRRNKIKLYLIGTGMGDGNTLTLEAQKALAESEVVFGANRLLENIEKSDSCKVTLYKSQEILDYLENHRTIKTAAVVFSGDVGFYSGATGFTDSTWEGEQIELCFLPGISSVHYFAAKLQQSWQDWKLLSNHGRECNILGHLRTQEKCFVLMSDVEALQKWGEIIWDTYGDSVEVSYGYQLSYPEEVIKTGTAEILLQLSKEQKGLYVLLLYRKEAKKEVLTPGLSDDAFLREKVPMTKEEIREISLCKLKLNKNAIVYDIGAGTGSISIECARLLPEGIVYAIEQKEEAIALLEKNKKHFAIQNMEIIAGTAPEALQNLPAPTHVFIGGSGKKLEEILGCLLEKKKEVNSQENIRVVINAVTYETVAEMMQVCQKYELEPEVVQIAITKAGKLGEYHLMQAQNPVTIVSFDI